MRYRVRKKALQGIHLYSRSPLRTYYREYVESIYILVFLRATSSSCCYVEMIMIIYEALYRYNKTEPSKAQCELENYLLLPENFVLL